MSAVFAANLLPGLAHNRRVLGVRCGQTIGRLAQCRYERSSNRERWRSGLEVTAIFWFTEKISLNSEC